MNHITIAGRVEEDPVRKEINGSVLCTFRIVSGRTGSKTGRLWIDIETWGHLAGICYQHLQKGRHVLIAGRLTQRQWADPTTSEKRTRLAIVAAEADFLDRRQTEREGALCEPQCNSFVLPTGRQSR